MCKCTPSKPGQRFCGVGRCSIDRWDYSQPFADVRRAAPTPPPRRPAPSAEERRLAKLAQDLERETRERERQQKKPEAGLSDKDAARIARRRARREKDRAEIARVVEAAKPKDALGARIAELQAKPRPTKEERLELSNLLIVMHDRMPQNRRPLPKIPY